MEVAHAEGHSRVPAKPTKSQFNPKIHTIISIRAFWN